MQTVNNDQSLTLQPLQPECILADLLHLLLPPLRLSHTVFVALSLSPAMLTYFASLLTLLHFEAITCLATLRGTLEQVVHVEAWHCCLGTWDTHCNSMLNVVCAHDACHTKTLYTVSVSVYSCMTHLSAGRFCYLAWNC